MAESIEVREGERTRCDFCSSFDVKWAFPARDFPMPEASFVWKSKGGWAACQRCHDLIQANDRENLVTHLAKSFVARAKLDPTVPRAQKRMSARAHRPHFRSLMDEFFRHRTGKPYRSWPTIAPGDAMMPSIVHRVNARTPR